MKPEVLKALNGSIAKWEEIVAGTGKDLGAGNCPLCGLFNRAGMDPKDECVGCPVAERTGTAGCCNSPYDDWVDANGGWGAYADSPDRKAAAEDELNFLKSLLPADVSNVRKD